MDYLQFGRSLWPVLEDPQNEHRREAVSEHEGEIMLLDREWKAALNAEGQVYLLFDVQDDPEEAENLAGRPEMAQVESGLRGRLLEHLVSTQLVGFSLVSNLVLPIGTIMAERLLYLPSVGFCLLAAVLLQGVWELGRKRLYLLACAVLLLSFLGRTWIRNGDWRDSETLFRAAVAAYPMSAEAHQGLGEALMQRGDWIGALDEYEQALAIYPGYAAAQYNTGLCYWSLQQ